jgi:hypothetical protein
MLKTRFGAGVLLLSAMALSLGCGSSEPFDYVPVTGSVKFEDGSLIEAHRVVVTFHPQSPPKDPKTHPRPGVAQVNTADGTFTQVTSHKPNDGIVPGLHKVTVQAIDENEQPVDIIAPEFTDVEQTPLTHDTASGNKYDFKVKKKQ